MSDCHRTKGSNNNQYFKRKHDLEEEEDISRKKKKKFSSSESEDSDDSTSSSSSSSSCSSESSTSSSESPDYKKKKSKKRKQKLTKKEKKRKKKLKLIKKKAKKKLKKQNRKAKSKPVNVQDEEESTVGPVPLPGTQEIPDRSKRMAPMTKEEWEKKQSVVRRVFDEATGRHRLIKGDGEVLEEIVSKQRHQEINRQATQGDGASFQNELALKLGQSNK